MLSLTIELYAQGDMAMLPLDGKMNGGAEETCEAA
jgi:hypothetical protein